MRALKEEGVDVVCEDLGDCYACYTKGDDTKVITLEKGIKYFSKIVNFIDVPPGANCEIIYALPQGKFVFADDVEELAKQVASMIKRKP